MAFTTVVVGTAKWAAYALGQYSLRSAVVGAAKWAAWAIML